MKVYLAGRWSRRKAISERKSELEELGITVTSRWLTGSHNGLAENLAAQEDLEDIDKAKIFILFTEYPYRGYLTGGRMVELGYAIAQKKEIFVYGPRENVFC